MDVNITYISELKHTNFHCCWFRTQIKLHEPNSSTINSMQSKHFLLFTIIILITYEAVHYQLIRSVASYTMS